MGGERVKLSLNIQSRVPVEFYNRVLSVLELMMIKEHIFHIPFVF